ncbi:MAG: hypothetical protein NTV32_03225 [Gammaproteobacteria bacterium]|nr:hypothetical protein [Gammaproteobacteria bacterium]
MTKDYKDISLQDLILEEQKPVQVEEPAIEPQDESILPTPPTGTRINKRGKNIILLAGAGLGIYIIWAIFHLSPKVETASPSAADSMNISSTSLGKQQQQGDGLVTSLRVQAYGSASTPLQGTPEGSATANLPIPAGAVAPQQQATAQQANVPGNLSTVTQNQSSPSQGSSFGGFGGGSGQQQTPYQQAVQNGMQSGLTPDGFQTGNSGSSQNTPAQPAMSPVSPAGVATPQAAPAAASDNQNMQGEKNAFLQSAQSPSQSTLQGGVQNPASPYMVMAGSVIPATLITGINSDLPGQIQAIVSQNVYDSSTGNSVLIPQGARLVGQYDSQVAYGQSRVLIVWSRIIFPNDQSLDLQGMPGADLSGFAGLHDQVDNHYIRIFGSALLMSVFSAGMQLSQPQTSSVNGASPSNQQIIAGAMGQELSQTATQMIQQNLNIQPTLNIRPGDNFNVLVTRDIPFSGPYNSNGGQGNE